MSAHTPGPWEVSDMHANCVFDQNDVLIVDASDAGSGVKRASTRKANASLIAEAPAMLECLEMALRAFNVEALDPLIAMATIEKIRAIISRAKGMK